MVLSVVAMFLFENVRGEGRRVADLRERQGRMIPSYFLDIVYSLLSTTLYVESDNGVN